MVVYKPAMVVLSVRAPYRWGQWRDTPLSLAGGVWVQWENLVRYKLKFEEATRKVLFRSVNKAILSYRHHSMIHTKTQ